MVPILNTRLANTHTYIHFSSEVFLSHLGEISLPSPSSKEKGCGYFEHSCLSLDPHLEIHNKTLWVNNICSNMKLKFPKVIHKKVFLAKQLLLNVHPICFNHDKIKIEKQLYEKQLPAYVK